MVHFKKSIFFIFLNGLFFFYSTTGLAKNYSDITQYLGKNDAVILTDQDGKHLYSHNPQKKLIPASTLKIFTTLFALHSLGPAYKFKTEFYIDNSRNLTIKGYGDPLLISEELNKIAKALSKKTDLFFPAINNIILDGSYFDTPITIPGVTTNGSDPYNAPNGGLCVNFNTVNFKKEPVTGQYISAEPQTPLLPFVKKRIQKSAKDRDRIILSTDNDENILYSGHLMKYFLEKNKIRCEGQIQTGIIDTTKDRLIFTHTSSYTLTDLTSKLLYFSNNFIANQLLLTIGAYTFGPPATLDKGRLAAKTYAEKILKLKKFHIEEGSGISRKNRITAASMIDILEKFEKNYPLLRNKNKRYYKTGTLHGISTQAGYITGPQKKMYRYVILLNTPGKSAKQVVSILEKRIENL